MFDKQHQAIKSATLVFGFMSWIEATDKPRPNYIKFVAKVSREQSSTVTTSSLWQLGALNYYY